MHLIILFVWRYKIYTDILGGGQKFGWLVGILEKQHQVGLTRLAQNIRIFVFYLRGCSQRPSVQDGSFYGHHPASVFSHSYITMSTQTMVMRARMKAIHATSDMDFPSPRLAQLLPLLKVPPAKGRDTYSFIWMHSLVRLDGYLKQNCPVQQIKYQISSQFKFQINVIFQYKFVPCSTQDILISKNYSLFI